jgi:ferric-dicitrate binding protein FerR (iron transport regulator)
LPEAVVDVTGTVFAVFRNSEGSCVCVLEGTVRMQHDAGAAEVLPLRRRLIPAQGEPPREEPIRAMERMKLEMLRDQVRELWSKAAEHRGDS